MICTKSAKIASGSTDIDGVCHWL